MLDYFRCDSKKNINGNVDDSNTDGDLWSYHKRVTSLALSSSIDNSTSSLEAELKQYLDLPLMSVTEDALSIWE